MAFPVALAMQGMHHASIINGWNVGSAAARLRDPTLTANAKPHELTSGSRCGSYQNSELPLWGAEENPVPDDLSKRAAR
jgi:hypothetical protein